MYVANPDISDEWLQSQASLSRLYIERMCAK